MQRLFNFFGFSLIDAKLRFKKELVGGVIGAIARPVLRLKQAKLGLLNKAIVGKQNLLKAKEQIFY